MKKNELIIIFPVLIVIITMIIGIHYRYKAVKLKDDIACMSVELAHAQIPMQRDTIRDGGSAEENEGGPGSRPTAHQGSATEDSTTGVHADYHTRDQRHGSSAVPATRQLLLLQRPVGRPGDAA